MEVVEEVVDEMFSPTKRRDVAFLWKTQRERSAWQVKTLLSRKQQGGMAWGRQGLCVPGAA